MEELSKNDSIQSSLTSSTNEQSLYKSQNASPAGSSSSSNTESGNHLMKDGMKSSSDSPASENIKFKQETTPVVFQSENSRKNYSNDGQDSSNRSPNKPATIVVQSAVKYYGSGKNKILALNGLNMRVPHGAIYGLLGPSGCGKTSLLGCLVNQLKLDSGKIYLFGFEPGSVEASIPGERVGFMPQELALYQEFSILETFQYFGRLVGLQSLTLLEKTKFLLSFLDLPDASRRINELSGGQQRRVSLASAILHEPELLVLDEPTVGVDPLLRTSIWNHLVEISQWNSTTIVITTHYIEEAKQANKIGLMRNGKLLAEASPQSLLDFYRTQSLENVFLKLCDDDSYRSPDINAGEQVVQATSIPKSLNAEDFKNGNKSKKSGNKGIRRVGKGQFSMLKDDENENVLVQPWVVNKQYGPSFSVRRSGALMIKNSIRLRRNLLYLMFSFALPPFQTILFCVTVGGNPHDLPVAVVNLDNTSCTFPLTPDLSNIYLSNVNEDIIKQKSYFTFEEGYDSVVSGKNWGLVFINDSFSCNIINPLPSKKTDESIHVYMDDTNQEISYTIKIALYRALEITMEKAVSKFPISFSKFYDLPIKFEEPVYPVDNSSFRNFVAPGVVLTIVFFMAVGLTSLSFIVERREGLLDRSWVAGVKPAEVIFAHLATQTCILIVQITLILVFMFPVFNIPCEGNIFWVILMSLLQGLCGMSFGFMISALSKDELTAIQIILGTFYPILLMSGIVWPIEGMPTFMRYISYILPQTYACEGLRAVLFRGWGIAHFEVWIGFIITIIWTVIYVFFALFAIRIKK